MMEPAIQGSNVKVRNGIFCYKIMLRLY